MVDIKLKLIENITSDFFEVDIFVIFTIKLKIQQNERKKY